MAAYVLTISNSKKLKDVYAEGESSRYIRVRVR
jgi:hypothetical protein